MEKYYIARCFNGAPEIGPDVVIDVDYGPFNTAEAANAVLFDIGAEFFGFRPDEDDNIPPTLYGCYDKEHMAFNSMNCNDREMAENLADILDFYFANVVKVKV